MKLFRRLIGIAGCMSVAASSAVYSANNVYWSEPSSGTYSDGTDWLGGQAPLTDDRAVFGGSSSTIGNVAVEVSQNEQNLMSWIAAGDYEFSFGEPAFRLQTEDLVLGGGNTENFLGFVTTLDDLGGTPATLLVETPGTIDVDGDVRVGSSPFDFDRNQPPRPGALTLDGQGVLLDIDYGSLIEIHSVDIRRSPKMPGATTKNQ